MVQLAEWLLPIPDALGFNLVVTVFFIIPTWPFGPLNFDFSKFMWKFTARFGLPLRMCNLVICIGFHKE